MGGQDTVEKGHEKQKQGSGVDGKGIYAACEQKLVALAFGISRC